MLMRLLFVILAIMPFGTKAQAGFWDSMVDTFTYSKPKAPSIKVLVLHDVERASLEVKGKYTLVDPNTDNDKEITLPRVLGKKRDIEPRHDGIKWGEAFPDYFQFKVVPGDPKTEIILNDKEFKGNLYVYNIGDSISVVNQTPIEQYVRALLTNNYEQYNLHPEALAAVTIAVRTNAYFQANNPKSKLYAVDGKKVGFDGMVDASPDVVEAVKVTRYMILSKTGVYEKKATPFAAQFTLKDQPPAKEAEVSKLSLEEINKLAQKGEHAAQILSKAFPNSQIVILEYGN